MHFDQTVAQLLSSRICHDLVGPIGAVNSGLELLEEDFDDDGAAKGLIIKSADEAKCRLSFYRAAFGKGASNLVDTSWKTALNEARNVAEGFLKGSKVSLDWGEVPSDLLEPVLPASIKVILNLVLMAYDSLPRGGSVGLSFAVLGEGFGVGLAFSGEGANLRDDLRSAIELELVDVKDVLSARNVHAFLAQQMAQELGAFIEYSDGSRGEGQLAVLFPKN